MQFTDITDFLGFTDTKSKEPEPADKLELDPEKLGEKETLYKWKSPVRTTMKAFGGKLRKNMLIIGGVVALFLLLIGEYFVILVIASVIFISYILSSTPPEEGEYELTTHGIQYMDQFYYWNELENFFFSQAEDDGKEATILNVDIKDSLTSRLFMVIDPKDKEKVKEICSKYLPYKKEAPETALDKAYKKITSKLDI